VSSARLPVASIQLAASQPAVGIQRAASIIQIQPAYSQHPASSQLVARQPAASQQASSKPASQQASTQPDSS